MNYVDGGYVSNELANIHRNGCSIEVDLMALNFKPESMASDRISKFVGCWGDSLKNISHLTM